MKIAMFTNTYLPHVGGVAHSVHTCEQELRRRGNDIHVVAPTFAEAEESTEKVLRVPAIQNFNGSDFSVRIPQPWLISDCMAEFHPEVVHSHHPFLLGDSALRTAHERGLPLIFTHHTMYEQYSHYVPLDSDALRRVAIQLATEYCNLCDYVIAPSESIEILLKNRGVNAPIATIPTGIDLEFFGSGNRQRFRNQFDIDPDAKVIGHVGRLAAEKNLHFLAKAVGLYLSDHPSVRFLVIGDGPAKVTMEDVLLAHAAPEQIVFAGCQCGQNLTDGYAAMDLFAFSSRSETQGMVVAEAMAAGIPVVALDGPGVREVMNERNGRLLNAEAACDEFATTLSEFLDDAERLRQTGKAAKESVQPYGLQCSANRLSDLYRRMIDEFESWGGRELEPWDQLQGRIEAEFKLFTEKATALAAAIAETEATKTVLT